MFLLDKKMQTENTHKAGRSLTPEGQIRRKRKTQDIKREIRQEWCDTERGYMLNKPRNPASFYWLPRLAAAAGDDYRKNGHKYGEQSKNFTFNWRPANAEPIKENYFITGHGNIALKPPVWCVFTRSAIGLKQAKGHYQQNAAFNKRIADYLYSTEAANTDRFTGNDLLIRAGGVSELDIKAKHQSDVGRLMALLGWDRRRESTQPRRHYYSRPATDRSAPA